MGSGYWDTRTHVWNGEGFDVVELPPVGSDDDIPPAINTAEFQRKAMEAHEAARIEHEAAGIQPPPMDDLLVALMKATEIDTHEHGEHTQDGEGENRKP